jgi:hypothetical protein
MSWQSKLRRAHSPVPAILFRKTPQQTPDDVEFNKSTSPEQTK